MLLLGYMYPILKPIYVLVRQQKTPYLYKAFADGNENYSVNHHIREIINTSACELLELCTGENTIEDIVNIFIEKYNEEKEKLNFFVNDFINECVSRKIVSLNNEKSSASIFVRGSYETTTPILAVVELTKMCPLKCKHCLNHSGDSGIKELTTQEWLQVFGKLKNIGIQKINLTGGEVFARKDFFELLDFCSKNFLAVSINSNGFYIDENASRKISEYKHNVVFQISIDGLEKNHNSIRGNNQSFERAVIAIASLAKYKVSVSVAFTCNQDNFLDN